MMSYVTYYENEENVQNMHRLKQVRVVCGRSVRYGESCGFQSNQDAFGIAMLQHGSSWLSRTAIIVLENSGK